jgi:N utilization substance protein B
LIALRRKSRERALQALYQVDVGRADPQEALKAAASAEAEEGASMDASLAAFASELVEGVVKHLAELDALIQKHSLNWRVERMAKIDRNVLRLGAYELGHYPETPGPVVINEAIELGKTFGSEESSAFINAILDKIARDLGKK